MDQGGRTGSDRLDRTAAPSLATFQSLAERLEAEADLAFAPDKLRKLLTLYGEIARRAAKAGAWPQMTNALSGRISTFERLADAESEPAWLDRAASACRTQLRRLKRRQDPSGWAAQQNRLGAILLNIAETGRPAAFGHAATALEKALKVWLRTGNVNAAARTANNLGMALQGIGEALAEPQYLTQAANCYGRAIDAHLSLGAATDAAVSRLNRATVLQALADHLDDGAILDQAISDCTAALAILDPDQDGDDWGMGQNNLGTALGRRAERRGEVVDYEAAAMAFAASIDRLDPLVSAYDWLMTRANLADAALGAAAARRDLDAAARSVALLQETLALRPPRFPVFGTGLLLSKLAFAQRAQGLLAGSSDLLDAAAVSYAEALAAFESAEANEDAVRTAGGLARLLVRRRRLGEALAVIDNALARAARLASEAARSLGGRRRLADLTSDLYAHMSYCRWATGDVQGALEAAERGRGRWTDDDAVDLSPADLVRLCAAATPDGGALVLPVLGDSFAFAFVLVDGDPTPFVMTDEIGLVDGATVSERLSGADRWLGLYNRTVASSVWRRADADGQAAAVYQTWNSALGETQAWLWHSLCEPVDRHLRTVARLPAKAPVALCLPGLLSNLPVAAAGPDAQGRFFGDLWTVHQGPSLHALAACRRRAHSAPHQLPRLLSVLDTGDGPPLPSAETEARMLRLIFPSPDAWIVSGTAATRAAILAALPSATHFHAAVHGAHDAISPQNSGLRLRGGDLTADQIAQTPTALRLAYLAACESGQAGVRRSPDAAYGLANSFLRSGAACVISTLWPVFDDAAFWMTYRFYALNRDGERERAPPAAALASAMAWLRTVSAGELRALAAAFDDELQSPGAVSRFNVGPPPPPTPATAALDDAARPYAAPVEWAAYTVLGC